MKELTFNEWQEHLAIELQKNYLKLNLIRNEKLQTIPRREPRNLRRVQKVRVSANK
jgi:hypothetical protein